MEDIFKKWVGFMLRIIRVLALCACFGNAAFVSTTISDSRIQSENNIYNPSGIIGYSFEYGIFNEQQNILDFKTSVEVKRLGYSHADNDGSTSTSLWTIGARPIIVRLMYNGIYLDCYGSIGYIMAAYNINDYFESKLYRPSTASSYSYGYGYKLGYLINSNWEIGLSADYRYVEWRLRPSGFDSDRGNFWIGGIGATIQYNVK